MTTQAVCYIPSLIRVAPRNPSPLQAALFLDRDGVINVNRADYVKSWHEFEFIPAALEALKALAAYPWPVVVVTNQAIINRGWVAAEQVERIHQRMCQEVEAVGGRIDAIYWCPHRPAEACTCRKPQPGLLLQAASDLHLDLNTSWLIGDAVSDVQAAIAAGAHPLLVQTGRGSEQLSLLAAQMPNFSCPVLPDLSSAVRWLVSDDHWNDDHQRSAFDPPSNAST